MGFVRGAWPAIAVVSSFVATRLAYRVYFDIHFDTSPVYYFLQYLDPWFVDHDFLRSVLYLHHQAPLQVFVAQGAMKLLGLVLGARALEVIYAALGLSVALALTRILVRLGVPRLVAVAAVVLYTSSPTFVLYENWLFYPMPTAAILVLSTLALVRLYGVGTFGSALLFFSLLAAVALLRSTFGSVFVASAALLVAFRPPVGPLPLGKMRYRIFAAAALPLLVTVANAAKTQLLVGHPYGAALLWTNLCVKIVTRLPDGEAERLFDQGILSNAGQYGGPFTDVDSYGALEVPHAPTGVPLLDFDHAPEDGANNSHALEHLLVAEKYYKPDALYLLAHYRGAYAAAVWDSLSQGYMMSAVMVDGLEDERDAARLEDSSAAVDRAMGVTANGRLVALMIVLPLATLYGLSRVVGRRAALGSRRTTVAATMFVLLVIAYEGSVTTLVSYGDMARYRFDVDALYFLLVVLLSCDIARRIITEVSKGRGQPKPATGWGT
jgi:hypothetical protein